MSDSMQVPEDELKKIDEGVAEEAAVVDTPEPAEPETSVEEKPAEEEPVAEEPAEEEKPKEEESQQPSRREQLRIQDLLKKYGPPPERQAPSQPQQPVQGLNYAEALDADPEVIERLEADRQATGQAQYQAGQNATSEALQYSQFYNNIRFDLPLVKDKLSKLDPTDAKALDDEYIAITGADTTRGTVRNPNIGYAEFIEARIEQAERLAASMVETTTKNIAKQAATTGLRPDGSTAKRLNLNQAPEDMSLEELYAKIGQAPPKK